MGREWPRNRHFSTEIPEFRRKARLYNSFKFLHLRKKRRLSKRCSETRYILHEMGLKAPADTSEFVPFLALDHLHRFIFVAPLYFRLVHWFDPQVLTRSP